MLFECKICDYTTDDKWNFIIHKKSKKHTINIEKLENNCLENSNVLICNKCNIIFENINDTIKHISLCNKHDYIRHICSDNVIKENELQIYKKLSEECIKKIDILKNKINKLKKKINITYEPQITELKKEINEILTPKMMELKKEIDDVLTPKIIELEKKNIELETTVKMQKENNRSMQILNNNCVINSNTTSINVIRNVYANAPPIVKITKEKAQEMIETTFKFDKETNYDMCERILYLHNENTLCTRIKNMLVEFYKKANPFEQAVWTTDVSRQCYAIKDTINNENMWYIDKQGVLIKQEIIKIFETTLIEFFREYVNNIEKKLKYYLDSDRKTAYINEVKTYEKAKLFIYTISDKIFADAICKDMAADFYFDKKAHLVTNT
jgi:hypothetical protein